MKRTMFFVLVATLNIVTRIDTTVDVPQQTDSVKQPLVVSDELQAMEIEHFERMGGKPDWGSILERHAQSESTADGT